MNRLFGEVEAYEARGEVAQVTVRVPGGELRAFILEADGESDAWRPGTRVTALVKESEVALAFGENPATSHRNRLPCTVVAVEGDAWLAHVRLEFHGRPLHALIAADVAAARDLQPGSAVFALIQATDLSLAAGHVSA